MRVLVAFDKFKDTLAAAQACSATVRALRGVRPGWEIDPCPLTDGGEGFAGILIATAGGRRMSFPVTGPRGGPVNAAIGLVDRSRIPPPVLPWLQPQAGTGAADGPLAIIEMAAASGLSLLPTEQRDPWLTTTYGTGQLIRAAAELGCSGVLLGAGGSATIDLGAGALSALGFEFRDAAGARIRPPTPAHFERLASIEGEAFASIPPICVACDVDNPLLGPDGAASVYGAQKGLRTGDSARFEAALARMAALLGDCCRQPSDLPTTASAGAAGGLPFGLMAGMRARLAPGFAIVSAWLGLDSRIAAADIVVTGEGCFDTTSLSGKGPGTVAMRALALGKTVHVFAGRLGEGLPDRAWGLHAVTPQGHACDPAGRDASAFLIRAVQAAFENAG